MDIRLNSDFDITLDHRNDLPTVSGRAEFEQRLTIRLTDYFQNVIGTVDRRRAVDLLRLQAQRIVDDLDGLVGVAQLSVTQSADEPNTLEVTIIYDMGEEFAVSLSE
jgi:hypothetical protein